MQVDFSNWAVVAHKDDSGFGRQAEDIRSVLGVGYHLAIPSERLQDKPLMSPREIRLDPKLPLPELREMLRPLDGIIFFERHSWHPALLKTARDLDVKTVCVPNWEWFRGADAEWEFCDLFACPTKFTLEIVRGYGWRNSIHLPWTLNLDAFNVRKISGPARLFIHNAGLIDHDDRKGTRDTILAFDKVRRKDIRLIVRMQKPATLPKMDDRIEVRVGNLENPAELYKSGDAAIQPSKMEGIGFMVLEPVCCGMPVITTDYPPMNEFVQQIELRAHKKWFKRRAYATQWIKHAHLRLPSINDLARKIEWCADNDLSTISAANRAWAETTFNRERLKREWNSALGALSVHALNPIAKSVLETHG